MSDKTTLQIDLTGVGEYIVQAFPVNEIFLGKPLNNDLTGGTISFRVKGVGATDFETPTVSSIDASAPERVQIDGSFTVIEVTPSTITGGATLAELHVLGND